MNRFIKARVDEHKDLLIRIAKLEDSIANWNPKNSTHSHVTYANLAILLASYKKAAEAVECILTNMGVTLDEDGCYREVIDKVRWPISEGKDEPQGQPQSEQENEHK